MRRPRTARSQFNTILLIISLLLPACAKSIPDESTPSPTSLAPIPSGINSGVAASGIQIYFTDPNALHATDYEGGPDEVLVAALAQARLSVDVAAYSLDLWSIRDALINAHKRGVVV